MRCTLAILSSTLLAVVAFSSVNDTSRNVFGRCVLPLGMEEGKIPDNAITASSSYETKSVGPQNARIRQEKNGGAWCPKAQISSATREYLEIDLTKNHLIAWTETQGRFGNGQGQEYAEAFFLEYWRDAEWHQYQNLKGERVRVIRRNRAGHPRCFLFLTNHAPVLRGNSNTYLVEKQKLDLPFVANRVRFVPYSQHPRTVCMRVEIYGCVWNQHVTGYTAPKGSPDGPAGRNVQDSSYDGTELDGLTTNGLGQLTDGILGELSEIVAPSTIGTSWVGWSERDTVQLVFQFQELRRFENCSVHAARLPALRIEMFSVLRFWFSVDGESYESSLETSIDVNSSSVSTVLTTVPLQSSIGKFAKMEFRLTGEWLLLSEVTFHTVSGWKNQSTESVATDSNESEFRIKPSIFHGTIFPLNETDERDGDSSTPDAFPVGTSQTYVGLVGGLLTVTVLLLTCTAFLVKQRGRDKVALLQKHTAFLCDSSTTGIPITAKDARLSDSIANGLSLFRSSKPPSPPSLTKNPTKSNDSPLITVSDHSYSTVYRATYELSGNYQTDAVAGTNAVSSALRIEPLKDFTRRLSYAKEFAMPSIAYSVKQPQAVKEITGKRQESWLNLSPFTPLLVREIQSRSLNAYDVRCVSRHRLRILDKLGEGNFGLVHLCEAKGIMNPDTGLIQSKQTVIVRSLWRGVVDSLRLDFTDDMRILSMLSNPNVARMMALVEEEPFGAVFEYSQYGDLSTYLNRSDIAAASRKARLNFIKEIASGMSYLESLNISHCDLAARNCIVSNSLTIKVSDHAMYCSKYDHQYYTDGSNRKIPLRWMAWEAVLLGKRDCRADVWSFAVTVWEIYEDCKDLPYPELTAEQVLENCGLWYRRETGTINNGTPTSGENNQARVPSRPSRCSDQLYRVMNECWSKRVEDRPTFHQISLYFQTMGLG